MAFINPKVCKFLLHQKLQRLGLVTNGKCYWHLKTDVVQSQGKSRNGEEDSAGRNQGHRVQMAGKQGQAATVTKCQVTGVLYCRPDEGGGEDKIVHYWNSMNESKMERMEMSNCRKLLNRKGLIVKIKSFQYGAMLSSTQQTCTNFKSIKTLFAMAALINHSARKRL